MIALEQKLKEKAVVVWRKNMKKEAKKGRLE
jgi:hypothetical protein